MLSGEQVGAKAVEYPRRHSHLLTRIASTPWPRAVGGSIGVLALLAVIVTGMFGPSDSTKNASEYIVWIYFWAATVILSGLLGNLWYLFNPWAAISAAVARFPRLGPVWKLPDVGVWPAVLT